MRVRSPARVFFLLVLAALAAGAIFFVWRKQPGAAAATAPGVVRETEIHIAPEVAGRLESVAVVPGQRVGKGEILAVLSIPELTAAVGEARAAAANARADRANVYAGVRKEEVNIAARNAQIAESNVALAQQQNARSAALAARDFASRQQFDENAAALAKAQASLAVQRAAYARAMAGPTIEERAVADAKVALADAAVASLEAKLAKTRLVAPVDGAVGILVAKPGEVISPGESIMTFEAGRERWFTFTVREDRLHNDHLGAIAIGAPLRLRTAKGETIEARVTELRPLGEFATWRAARAVGDHDLNSFLVRADPVGGAVDVEPGMTVWIDGADGAGGKP